jgi:hypothetical protein
MAVEAVLLSCLISSHTCSIRFCMFIGHWFALHVDLANVWRAVRFLSRSLVYLHVAILLTYRCTILWSSRQVVCTSGSIEFPDKSYNSFGVSVESLATFDKFKLYPYIINNKVENFRKNCNQNKKYSEEKQASLKLCPAVTMPTAFAFLYKYTLHFIPLFSCFFFFLNPANSREHMDT